MTTSSDFEPWFTSAMRQSRNLMIALGVVMIIAGIAAIIFPFFGSLGVTVCVGVMFVIAGIAQGIGAFSYAKWTGIVLGLIVAALWLFGGGYLLMRPLEGVFILTVVVATIFLIEGILKAIFSFQIRPAAGWGWVLFDAIASFALGVLLWWQMPLSAVWALGILAGIRIMIAGWTLVMVPMAASKFYRGDASSPEQSA